jgi:hypothetical protein
MQKAQKIIQGRGARVGFNDPFLMYLYANPPILNVTKI